MEVDRSAPSPAETNLPTRSRGGSVLSVHPECRCRRRGVDGVVAGLEPEGRATTPPGACRARLHRCAHAPREPEAHGRRVRPACSHWDDGRRRRPTRNRERARSRRCALAARRELRAPARRLLHGLVVCACVALRVAAAAADSGRPGVADASQAGARACRDDELSRRHRRLAGRAREARSRGRTPRRARLASRQRTPA